MRFETLTGATRQTLDSLKTDINTQLGVMSGALKDQLEGNSYQIKHQFSAQLLPWPFTFSCAWVSLSNWRSTMARTCAGRSSASAFLYSLTAIFARFGGSQDGVVAAAQG